MKDIVFRSLKFPLLLEWMFEWMNNWLRWCLKSGAKFWKMVPIWEKGVHSWRDHKIMAMELKFLLMRECCLIEFWWRFQIFRDFLEEMFDVWKLGKNSGNFLGVSRKFPGSLIIVPKFISFQWWYCNESRCGHIREREGEHGQQQVEHEQLPMEHGQQLEHEQQQLVQLGWVTPRLDECCKLVPSGKMKFVR